MYSKNIRAFLVNFLMVLNVSFNATAEPTTVIIPAQFHPLDNAIISVLNIPTEASASSPVPACLIIHGSGGLFSEGNVGEDCNTSASNMSQNYSELMDLFNDLDVASIAPSSFVSRDARFCEDNDDDYFQFVAPPLHNPGDGLPMRDKYYKMRRVVVRTLDLMASYDYLCSLDNIDCSRTCMVGTSNGSTSIMSYIANGIGDHLKQYTNLDQQREHESQSDYNDRIVAFSHFPALTNDINLQLNTAPKPLFVNAVSPGCSLRKIVPTITADDNDFDPVTDLFDLYYASGETQLHLEIGSADDVPDACYNGGVREIQARDYEAIQNIAPESSRYLVSTYENAPHDLLGEAVEGEIIRQKIKQLAIDHFYLIFKNGFD